MKRDFSRVLRALGNDVTNARGEPMTLGEASTSALMANYADEASLSGEAKFQRYRLAEAITVGGLVEVSVEDVAMLKLLIGKCFTPVVVGPAYLALEMDLLPATEARLGTIDQHGAYNTHTHTQGG